MSDVMRGHTFCEVSKRKEKNQKHYAYKLVEEYFRPDKEHLGDVFEKSVRANLKEYLMWAIVFSMIFNADNKKLVKKEEQDATA